MMLTARRTRRDGRTVGFLLLAMLPIILGLAFIILYISRTWSASNAIKVQFAQWQNEGVPYDNATMRASYQKRTHAEGTRDWNRVIETVHWLNGSKLSNKLPYIGSSEQSMPILDPEASWPDEPLVHDYLNEMKPVLATIEKACQNPKPVRFSLLANGFSTSFEHQHYARSILRLLQLAFDHAYYHRDTEQAMKILELMGATAEAFDSKEAIVTELIQLALKGIRLQAIQNSLCIGIWNDEELEKLRNGLSKGANPSDGWKELMEGERAFSLAQLANPDGTGFGPRELYPLTPTGKKEFIDLYAKIVNVRMQTWQDALSFSKSLGVEIQIASRNSAESGIWMSMLMPAIEAFMSARIRTEESRRWVLTAIAIRQYKNKYGDWPVILRDLEKLGLTANDYSLVTDESLGYEVESNRAYLWTRDPRSYGSQLNIAIKRPNLHDYSEGIRSEASELLSSYLVELK
jgi:hypothetical protein